jgi:hypothetical protein
MIPLKNAALAASAVQAIVLLGASSLVSCDPSGTFSRGHALRIALPEAPASWAFLPDLRAALSWRAPGGAPRSMIAPLGRTVEIEVERGFPQEILALPSSAGRGLRPAGALYPEALAAAARRGGEARDEIPLDWIGGYVASAALALEGEGVDPRAYDLERLGREAAARSADPWTLPAVEAARRLQAGELRASAFDEPDRIAVPLPAGGPWAPESPFASAPRLASAPLPPFEADLPVGLWRYVGPEDELMVSVDADGSSAWVVRPRYGLP